MDVDVNVTRVPCVAPSASRTAGARTTCPSDDDRAGDAHDSNDENPGALPVAPAGLSRPTSGPRPAFPPPTAAAAASGRAPRASAVASDTNACTVSATPPSPPRPDGRSRFVVRRSPSSTRVHLAENRRLLGGRNAGDAATRPPPRASSALAEPPASPAGRAARRHGSRPHRASRTRGSPTTSAAAWSPRNRRGLALARRRGARGRRGGRRSPRRDARRRVQPKGGHRARAAAARATWEPAVGARSPPAVSPTPRIRPAFWPADPPPPAKTETASPSTTHPHCVRRFASTSRRLEQLEPVAFGLRRGRLDGVGERRVERATGDAARVSVDQADASAAARRRSSVAVSERETHAAPAHATNAGAA